MMSEARWTAAYKHVVFFSKRSIVIKLPVKDEIPFFMYACDSDCDVLVLLPLLLLVGLLVHLLLLLLLLLLVLK